MVPQARAEASRAAPALGMKVWFVGYENGEMGVYLRPTTAWSANRYMNALPAAANLAVQLARAHPSWGEVEVCEDAGYLHHDKHHPFVPATRVTVKTRDAGRLPTRFRSSGEVLRAVAGRTIELLLRPEITKSVAYRRAVGETVRPP